MPPNLPYSPELDLLLGTSNGLILLKYDAMVLGVNATARRVLETTTEIRIENGRLTAMESCGLAELIRRTANAGGRGFVLAVNPSNGSLRHKPLFLFLVSIPADVAHESMMSYGPIVAVVVGDPELELRPNAGVLKHLFGLTPRECTIAGIVMNGRGPESIVRELRITANTARGHMKAIMSKTGTKRQSELVRFLLSSPALTCPPELLIDLEQVYKRNVKTFRPAEAKSHRQTGATTEIRLSDYWRREWSSPSPQRH